MRTVFPCLFLFLVAENGDKILQFRVGYIDFSWGLCLHFGVVGHFQLSLLFCHSYNHAPIVTAHCTFKLFNSLSINKSPSSTLPGHALLIPLPIQLLNNRIVDGEKVKSNFMEREASILRNNRYLTLIPPQPMVEAGSSHCHYLAPVSTHQSGTFMNRISRFNIFSHQTEQLPFKVLVVKENHSLSFFLPCQSLLACGSHNDEAMGLQRMPSSA